MQTVTKPRSTSGTAIGHFELDVVPFTEFAVYATPKGVRFGAKGKVHATGYALGMFSKGRARQVRKALRRHGFVRHAAAARQPAANQQ